MATKEIVKKHAQCNTCTAKLISIAYRRVPWFRLLREPFKQGMRFMSWVHRVDPEEYEVRTSQCFGCIRFYKLTLKEKSALFRRLNDLCNPHFDAFLERIVMEEEIRLAKTYARAATVGEIKPEAAEKWMQGQHTGFGG